MAVDDAAFEAEVRMPALTIGSWRREVRQWLLWSLVLKAGVLTALWWLCFRGSAP